MRQWSEAVGQLHEPFMAPVRAKLLDWVYFQEGWRVQCVVRAVSVLGQRGLELSSAVVHISTTEGKKHTHTHFYTASCEHFYIALNQ